MLKQVVVRYDRLEDRLVIGLTATDAHGNDREHWLHFTRRLCEAWRVGLHAMLEQSKQTPQSHIASSYESTPGEGARARAVPPPVHAPTGARPSAENPVLVKGAHCGRSRTDGRWVLTLLLQQGAELQLRLDTPTMHALVTMILQKVSLTGWELPPLATEPIGNRAATPASKLLH